jgi:hypothetical protein
MATGTAFVAGASKPHRGQRGEGLPSTRKLLRRVVPQSGHAASSEVGGRGRISRLLWLDGMRASLRDRPAGCPGTQAVAVGARRPTDNARADAGAVRKAQYANIYPRLRKSPGKMANWYRQGDRKWEREFLSRRCGDGQRRDRGMQRWGLRRPGRVDGLEGARAPVASCGFFSPLPLYTGGEGSKKVASTPSRGRGHRRPGGRPYFMYHGSFGGAFFRPPGGVAAT